ncbi:hypothetical protein SAMN05444170_7391 [Bradyrhizobium erythrophlei]|uniref:DUF8201 domain-containing protein n=2 Tax=Bradyrhizobium erythrophlei TaxID=1437360 RepID=A0A1M7UXY9_9BRAD|nr:hypothetical protein SAMN05444170_7391 [Bradyrhizobium erythrophlei]
MLLLLPETVRVFIRAGQWLRTALKTAVPTALKIWSIIFSAVLAIFLVHALSFGSFGDDDGYHLSAPTRWLHENTLSYLPTYTNTNASMGFEMLYAIALSFNEPVAAKLLHYSSGLWTLLSIGLCARRLGDPTAGIIAISALLISNPVVNLSFIFPLAYVDFPSCWAAMLSVLGWLVWRRHPSQQLLSIVALCAGIAVSFKLTAAPLIIAWICTIALELRSRRVPWLETLRQLSGFSAIAAAPVCLWLLRNFVVTGNPLYPMLADFIKTRDWSAGQAEIFSRYMHYYAWGVASGAQLGELARKTSVILTTLLVAGIAGLLASRTRDTTSRILILFATIFTVVSAFLTGLYFRYWLFGIICFTLVGAIMLCRLVQEAGHRLATAIALISIALVVQVDRERREPQRLVTDLNIATGVLTSERAHAGDPVWRFWVRVRELTPPNAKILVSAFYTTFGASSFGCFPIDRQCYTTDSHLQRFIRLDTWPAFLESVRGAGIQYVIISNQQFTANRQGFTFTEGINEYPFCARLVEEYAEVIAADEHLLLYRLRTLDPS